MKKSMLSLASVVLMTGLAQAAPTQWATNGHFYEFVASNVTWANAVAQAASMSHLGMTGYLATVTSAEVNSFVSVAVGDNQLGWLGASDDDHEGQWTWRTGPETGQTLTYFNWNSSEPNNCCSGENYLQTNWAAGGFWNDHGGPGTGIGQANGFYVEYSAAVPEPAGWLLMAMGLVALGKLARRRPG